MNCYNLITFLVPIKDRVHVSKRLIKYLKSTPFKINLFVADGSKTSQKKIFETLKRKHNLTFFKSPYDEDFSCFTKKIFNSVKKIKTKYCCFMESDEFININDIDKIIIFMEKNNDCVLVRGTIRNFNVRTKNKIQILNRLYSIDKKLAHTKINFKNTKKIMPISCWEGVHRTKHFKNIFKLITKKNLKNVNAILDYIRIYTQLNGKIKFLENIVYSFRQANTHYFDNNPKDINSSANKEINLSIAGHYKHFREFLLIFEDIIYTNSLNKFLMYCKLLKYYIKREIIHRMYIFFKSYFLKIYFRFFNTNNYENLNNDEKLFLSKNGHFFKFNKKF